MILYNVFWEKEFPIFIVFVDMQAQHGNTVRNVDNFHPWLPTLHNIQTKNGIAMCQKLPRHSDMTHLSLQAPTTVIE